MPDRISKGVLDRGLDANTAFEIVSIDIADIDVGENIGARLADRSGRSGHAHRPGASRGASRRSDRMAAGDEGQGDRASREVGARRSRNTRSHCHGVPRRPVPCKTSHRSARELFEENSRPASRIVRATLAPDGSRNPPASKPGKTKAAHAVSRLFGRSNHGTKARCISLKSDHM